MHTQIPCADVAERAQGRAYHINTSTKNLVYISSMQVLHLQVYTPTCQPATGFPLFSEVTRVSSWAKPGYSSGTSCSFAENIQRLKNISILRPPLLFQTCKTWSFFGCDACACVACIHFSTRSTVQCCLVSLAPLTFVKERAETPYVRLILRSLARKCVCFTCV